MQTEDYLNDFFEKMTIPFVYFPQNNILSKKQLAIHTATLDNNLLLSTSWLFSFPATLSGLDYDQVVYIAEHAPAVYKKQLLETTKTTYKIREALEISKALDESNGSGTQNQDRLKNIIQYVKDNSIAFEF